MKSGFAYTAALSNADAQYWGIAAASGGAFSVTNVIPGTYTFTLFKGELEVYTSSVVVTVSLPRVGLFRSKLRGFAEAMLTRWSLRLVLVFHCIP